MFSTYYYTNDLVREPKLSIDISPKLREICDSQILTNIALSFGNILITLLL